MKQERRDADGKSNSPQTLTRSLLFIDFSILHPVPERVCDIIRAARNRGCTDMVVNWGGSFPWTVNKAMRNEYSFPEEAVAGFCSLAERTGISILPYLPSLDKVEFALSTDCLSFFKRNTAKGTVALDPARPGVVPFLTAVLEDQYELFPDALFLAADLTSNEGGAQDSGILERFLRDYSNSRGTGLLVRNGNRWDADGDAWRTTGGGSGNAEREPAAMADRKCPVVFSRTDSGIGVLSAPNGGPIPFNDPTVYDRLMEYLGAGESGKGERVDTHLKLETLCGRIWNIIRETKEELLSVLQGLPCVDQRRVILCGRTRTLRTLVGEAERLGTDVFTSYRQFYPEKMLFSHLYAVLEAMREEVTILERRILQIIPPFLDGDHSPAGEFESGAGNG